MEKELPKGWTEVTIKEISFDLFAGGDVPKTNFSKDKTAQYQIPIYGNGIKDDGLFGYTNIKKVSYPCITISARGTIGYPVLRNVNFYPIVRLIVLHPFNLVELAYIKYVLTSIDFKNSGTSIPQLTVPMVEKITIPLPPRPAQQRIVAKLDTLFGHLDALKTRLDRIPQLLKDFRQKVLTQAVTGKLTEEWREGKEYNANTLVDKIRESHFLAGGHKRGNAANHDIEKHSNSFEEIPKSWCKAELREICHPEKPVTYGILMPGKEIKNGRPFLKVMAYPDDKIDFEKVCHTSIEIEENFKRARLATGDIVLSIRGTVGRVIIIPSSLNGANITQDSARISLQDGISNIYVASVLRSQIIQEIMASVTKGVAIRGINIGDVRFLIIPIPPIEEQHEIVRRVGTLFAKADQIEASYQQLKVKLEQLPQALLAKAFRGELVEQLPTDGDARELLEEIRKAKAVLEKGGKGKKMKVEDELRMVAEDGVRYGKK